MDYKIFNEEKKKGWACNTREDFEKWLAEFREWFQCQIFRNGEEKEQFAQQIKDLKEKKEAYFSKQWNRPVVNHYILRENEGIAFINLCNALAEYLNNKIKK